MTTFASYGNVRIVSGSLTIPRHGMWAADVALEATATLPTSGSLVIGNLTLQGHVFQQAAFGGQRTARLVAGNGGWRQTVAAKGYSLSSGVMLSLVLGDVAREVGETVNIPSDKSVGPAYTREGGPAEETLRLFAGLNWYIDAKGVTQITDWPATTIASPFTVEHQDGGARRMTIATEDYASWMPNASFSAPFLDATYTADSVSVSFDSDGKLRLEVMTAQGSDSDRLMAAFRALIRAEFPRLTYLGVYNYRVASVSQDGTTADLQAPQGLGVTLPDLGAVPLSAGLLGEQVKLTTGSHARVAFLNGDPTQPIIIGTDAFPASTQIGSGQAPSPIARLGDQVVSFLPPTLPVVGTVSGNPFTGTITVATPITGTITGGSSRATCGS